MLPEFSRIEAGVSAPIRCVITSKWSKTTHLHHSDSILLFRNLIAANNTSHGKRKKDCTACQIVAGNKVQHIGKLGYNRTAKYNTIEHNQIKHNRILKI